MKRITLILASFVMAAAAQAQVHVTDAWVRATVPQQKATGAFMQIISQTDARLIEARSPVAGVVEIHEMSMDHGVMRMRAVAGVDLPAGKTVALKPGGYHIMFMDLKAQVKAGEMVPLTLVIEGRDGKRQTVELQVHAKTAQPAGGMQQGGMKHGDMKH